ncbi:MAG: sce7726 family protein [Agitococcus sp.]|nr:sce7726 family protein [Agitococcus sp.]
MREQAIKQALARHLTAEASLGMAPVLLEEVEIHGGQVRADIVDVSQFHCYEIKSDGDSLARLMSQGACYALTFDRVTLVLALRHVEKAMEVLPTWWGVMVVPENEEGGFLSIRQAGANQHLEPEMLASLLKREECLDLLQKRVALKGWKSKSLYQIQHRIALMLSLKELKAEAKYYLGLRSPLQISTSFPRLKEYYTSSAL